MISLSLKPETGDAEQDDVVTRMLLRELGECDDVQELVMEQAPAPEGSKGVWGAWLKLKITPASLENVLRIIRDHLPGQPVIKMELEVTDKRKKIRLEASKREDFLAVMEQAREFTKDAR